MMGHIAWLWDGCIMCERPLLPCDSCLAAAPPPALILQTAPRLACAMVSSSANGSTWMRKPPAALMLHQKEAWGKNARVGRGKLTRNDLTWACHTSRVTKLVGAQLGRRLAGMPCAQRVHVVTCSALLSLRFWNRTLVPHPCAAPHCRALPCPPHLRSLLMETPSPSADCTCSLSTRYRARSSATSPAAGGSVPSSAEWDYLDATWPLHSIQDTAVGSLAPAVAAAGRPSRDGPPLLAISRTAGGTQQQKAVPMLLSLPALRRADTCQSPWKARHGTQGGCPAQPGPHPPPLACVDGHHAGVGRFVAARGVGQRPHHGQNACGGRHRHRQGGSTRGRVWQCVAAPAYRQQGYGFGAASAATATQRLAKRSGLALTAAHSGADVQLAVCTKRRVGGWVADLALHHAAGICARERRSGVDKDWQCSVNTATQRVGHQTRAGNGSLAAQGALRAADS